MVSSEIYRRAAYGSNHPLAIPRVATVMDLCDVLGWLPPGGYHDSPQATPNQLERFHTADYVEAVRSVSATGHASREVAEQYGLGDLA